VLHLIETADTICNQLFQETITVFTTSPINFTKDFDNIRLFSHRLMVLDQLSSPDELKSKIFAFIQKEYESENNKIIN
jgi:hypothetical protein